MGHVHTKSNSYALTRVTDQIICMSMSGVCLECRLRIQPFYFQFSSINVCVDRFAFESVKPRLDKFFKCTG